MPRNKESKNIKGVDHIQYVDRVDLFSYSIVGAVLGGVPRCCAKEDFNFVRAGGGAVILIISTLFGTNMEAIAGFFLYNIEGAMVGLIAGTSMEASIGTLAGLSIGVVIELRELKVNGFHQEFRKNALGKIFYKTLGGAFAGFFISEMKQVQQYLALYSGGVKPLSSSSSTEAPEVLKIGGIINQTNDTSSHANLRSAGGNELTIDSAIKLAIENNSLPNNITSSEVEFAGNATYENS